MIIKKCLECHNDFMAYNYEKERAKFCSIDCCNKNKIGKKRNKKGKYIKCYQCGRENYYEPYRIKRKQYFCNLKCMGEYRKGKELSEQHKNKISKALEGMLKKGGQFVKGGGYVMIYCPNHPNKDTRGYVRQHRLVMEKKLNRYLDKKEVVHHINGIKDDNRIENLEIYKSHSSHMRNHKNNLRNK